MSDWRNGKPRSVDSLELLFYDLRQELPEDHWVFDRLAEMLGDDPREEGYDVDLLEYRGDGAVK